MTKAADPPVVLALDVGTSSVRARFYDAAAAGVGDGPIAVRRYPWRVGDGAMTVGADDLVDHVFAVLDAAEGRARADGLEVSAVAMAAFWHGLLGLDAAGDPITPVFGWGDQQAAAEALRLRTVLDEPELHRRTGCFLHPSYPAVRLSWLRAREPELYAGAAAWVSFPEYLEARLFGDRRCSVSMASGTGLLDIHRLAWDDEWLDRLGLDARHLSRLVDAGDPLRGMRAEHAARWPRLAAAVWHPALGDGACANVGTGAVGDGRLGVTVGTSAAVRALWTAVTADVPPGLWCYRLDSRRWVAGRAMSNGGNGIAKLRRTLAVDDTEGWAEEAAAAPPDAHGLTVLPFLLGERGPGWSDGDPAAIVGMTHATTPAAVLRAWMEAVAYEIADAASALETSLGPADRVLGSGGALHAAPFWAAILADVLGRTVLLSDDREATARGAGLVTLERLGSIADLASPEAGGARPIAFARFEPDAGRHARYAVAMSRHRALEATLRRWRRTS